MKIRSTLCVPDRWFSAGSETFSSIFIYIYIGICTIQRAATVVDVAIDVHPCAVHSCSFSRWLNVVTTSYAWRFKSNQNTFPGIVVGQMCVVLRVFVYCE